MKTYLTEYKKDGKKWCGKNIKADSWEEAELKTMRKNEKVIGELVLEVDVNLN